METVCLAIPQGEPRKLAPLGGGADYGGYRMFWRAGGGQFKCAIGPHWFFALLGFLFFNLIAGGATSYIWSEGSLAGKLVMIVFPLTVDSVYLLAIVSNPGVVPRCRISTLEADRLSGKTSFCELCRCATLASARHCKLCGICIERLDHHCVWIGKCVGRGNTKIFNVFIALVPAFFMYLAIIGVLAS